MVFKCKPNDFFSIDYPNRVYFHAKTVSRGGAFVLMIDQKYDSLISNKAKRTKRRKQGGKRKKGRKVKRDPGQSLCKLQRKYSV